VREKYCWLAGGWKLVLELGERKILLGWRLLELPNRVRLNFLLQSPIASSQALNVRLGSQRTFQYSYWKYQPVPVTVSAEAGAPNRQTLQYHGETWIYHGFKSSNGTAATH